ncbi:MAG: nucleotidyl transferase AbiEii/AbiGii toxin family protein [Lentisphaeria bacterium]|nr:nucleotidyl transferase AbiEii/AbiGii toxin family protein [Lentisphaeria bacterium]
MNSMLQQMLDRYACRNAAESVNALREVMQELALLGLWRSKFFEQAAFYGGTALRIAYGLNRSSEDLDFSLLKPNSEFRLTSYAEALKNELSAFGFAVEFVAKEKNHAFNIDTAFLKGNTRILLISIGLPSSLTDKIYAQKELKIKFEIDLDPPPGFTTEVRTLLHPIPHSVRLYALPDLFAGKLHAVLCRRWLNRSKGRDWYDLVWYAAHHPAVNLNHLEQRMRYSGDYNYENSLTLETLKNLLHDAINKIELEQLRKDVILFLRDPQELQVWSKDFFRQVITLIQST